MMEIEPFVDAGIAAEFLSISRRCALEMARAGEIPAHPIGRGQRKIWRFRLSELAEAMANNTPAGFATLSRIGAGGPCAVVPKRRER